MDRLARAVERDREWDRVWNLKRFFPNGMVLVWEYNGYGWTFVRREQR